MTLFIKYGIKLNIDQLLSLIGDQFKSLTNQVFNKPSMFPMDGSVHPEQWFEPDGIEDLFDYDSEHDSWKLKKNIVSKDNYREIALIKLSGYNNIIFLHEIFVHFLYSKNILEVDDEYIVGVEAMNSYSRIKCMTDLVNDPPKEVKDKWSTLLTTDIFQSHPKIANQSPKVYLVWNHRR